MSLVVVTPGAQSLLQDLGRPGYGELGVGEGGAADRASARRANRLVGNPEGAVVVESLLGGLHVIAETDTVVAVTGAPAEVTVAGRPAPLDEAVTVPAGSAVQVGRPVAGLRTYLAVAGGIETPLVLGSGAASPAAGTGPAPLAAGDRLAVGPATGEAAHGQVGGLRGSWGRERPVRVVMGPRDDWFTPAARSTFTRTTWTATSDLDRVGVRLEGPALERARDGELLSEGTVRGAVQVPPNGQPVVFLADYPTTGGYPVIAVVLDEDVDIMAQLRPGDRVRFTAVTPPFPAG